MRNVNALELNIFICENCGKSGSHTGTNYVCACGNTGKLIGIFRASAEAVDEVQYVIFMNAVFHKFLVK
jgi:hypothetical protein